MPKRRSERARRRIAARTVANALALEAAVEVEEARPKLKKARYQTMLERLSIRGSLTARQRAAGDRIAADYRCAGDLPHVTMRYEARLEAPTKGSRAFRPEPVQHQIDARRRFERAVQALGPWMSPVIVHVAVLDQALTDWTRPGMKNGDGAALLRLALDVLADHYGLAYYEVSGEARAAA